MAVTDLKVVDNSPFTLTSPPDSSVIKIRITD